MLALGLVGLMGSMAATAPEAPFAPLEFLIGHCWRGTLADGASLDTHCFERLYPPHFVRDRHVVCTGAQRVYAGETTYFRAPGDKDIGWRYLSSAGLVMDGRLAPAQDVLRFTASYMTAQGKQEGRTTWTPGKNGYRAVIEVLQADGKWLTQADVEYSRADGPASCSLQSRDSG